MIQYLRHREINKNKWDESINGSLNGLIYAQSWYLNITSPSWEALVENDYESVMPLPVKQKYLIPYLIQPRFTQQLGIFSDQPISQEKISAFLLNIPRKFVWQNFNLNSYNPAENLAGTTNRHNYELPLKIDYSTIHKGYNENTSRNLKKAIQSGITMETRNETDVFIELYQTYTKINLPAIALSQLKSIMEYAIHNNCCEIVLAINSERNVVAGAFYLTGLNRIIYQTSFTSQEGQQKSAMFLIMDGMIKKYASQPCIFDFEGSMIPGIARFFAGFGAKKIDYQNYKYNMLCL